MLRIFNKKQYLVICAILFICFFACKQCFASVNVTLIVEGCNNNNICEPGEDNINCSNDCTPCNHNNVCELLKGESFSSCPSDCHPSSTSTPPGNGGGNPQMFIGKILNLKVKVGINYATVSWNTIVPTYGSVSWGIGDYNDGVANDIGISNHHKIDMENLSASTTYLFFVNSSLPESYYAKELGTFTTLPIPKIKTVPSIYNLTATSTSNEIILNWNNPKDEDFYGVKIVRSPFFFPADPFEGKIIYDGRGTYARDSDLSFDTKYYYSAFSYDKNLNFSSNVLVESTLKSKRATSSEMSGTDREYQNQNVNILPVNNFVFAEGDLESSISSSTVRIYPFQDIKIVVDKNRLPDQTKTLILKIQNPNDPTKIFSYSFNFDSVNNIFNLVVPNLGNENIYPFSIAAYNSNNKEISLSKGFLDVRAVKEQQPLFNFDISYLILIVLLTTLTFLLYQLRKVLK